MQLVLVYLEWFRRNSLLKCVSHPKIAKKITKNFILGVYMSFKVDPSAAAARRRARSFRHAPRRRRIFLWLSRIPAEFFKRSSQPNAFRRKFGANIQRSINETVC